MRSYVSSEVHSNRLATKLRLLGGASVLVISTALAVPAIAQSDNNDVETVIVSGSRISTPGFTAPTPVTSISQNYLQENQILQGEQIEFQFPQMTPAIVAQTQQAAGGSVGGSYFNLRGLGPTRTLTLLDGRRIMSTDYNGDTDTNILPTSLIKRIDTVTGGASSAYGSDAVARVVNIILDNDYEGLKGSASAGESQYHDDKTVDIWLTGGTSFAGGKGHIVVSGESYSDSGCNFCVGTRPWARAGDITVTNPLYKAGVANGQPNYVNFNNETFSALSSGGTITAGPLKGIQFVGSSGTPTPIQYGNYVGSMFMQGGSGEPFYQYGTLAPEIGRQSLYSHASYDLGDDISVWAQLLLSHETSVGGSTPNYSAGDITITNQNPFLPASIVAQMAANKISTFTLGRTNIDIPSNDLRYGPAGTPAGDFNIEVNSNYYVLWSAGLKGKLPALGNSWTWDLTGEENTNSYYAIAPDNRIQSNWQAAIDSVPNPAVGGVASVPVGSPVCRSSITPAGAYIIPGATTPAAPQPTAGCAPINIFGTGNVTQGQSNYFLATSYNYFPQASWDVSGNLQGVPFSDWAGDVSIATGFEVRRNSIHGYSDPGSILKEYRFNNIQPFTGTVQSEEGYLEASIPLLAGIPLVQSLNTDSAFRYINYSQSGGAETWKVGANWTVNDDIRLRYTWSRDIRAPNLNDLFSPVSQNFSQVTDLATNPPSLYSSAQGTGGNPNLQPEVGFTNTAGIVYSPSWLSGFQASIDVFQLHLHDAILAASAQGVINNCYMYNVTSFCSQLTRSPTTGLIVLVQATAYNVATISTQGADFEADYNIAADDIWSGLDGNFSFRTLLSFTDYYITTQPGSSINSVNQGNNTKWRGTATLGWNNDVSRVGVNFRFVGDERINATYTQCGNNCLGGVINTINNNTVPGRYYFGLSGDHVIPGFSDWKIFGSINNLFNVAPPNAANGIFIPQTSPNQIFDNIGRTYNLGVRFAL